jgi:hypothetical protein
MLPATDATSCAGAVRKITITIGVKCGLNVYESPEEIKICHLSEKGLCPMDEVISATKCLGNSEGQKEACLATSSTLGVDKR